MAATAFRRPSLGSSALQTFGRKIGVAVLSLVNVLVIARVLGPTGRGDVVFLTTLAVITAQFASLGVQDANVNFAGRDPRLRPALATASLVFTAVLSVIACALLALAIAFVPSLGGEVGAGIRWVSLSSIPMLLAATYLERLLEAEYRFTAENTASLATPVAILAVNGALAAVGRLTVGTAVAAWVCGIGLGTLIRLWYVASRLGGFGRPDLALTRAALAFGLKAHGARILGWGNYRIDQLLVGTIAGPRELGIYSYAVTWAETLFYLPQTLAAVQRPDLVRASRKSAAGQASRLFRAALTLSIPAALALAALAPILCSTLAGSGFAPAATQLRILVVGTVGILALQLLGNALTAQQRPLLETAAVAVAFVATIVLDVVLIPPHGGLGAAIASTLSYTAGGAAAVFLFAQVLGGRVRELVPHGGDVRWLRGRLPTFRRRPVPVGEEEASKSNV